MGIPKNVRSLVDRRVAELIDYASNQYGVMIPVPKVKYTLKGTSAGCACLHTNTVGLNAILLQENLDEFVEHTVGHEVAHIAVKHVWSAVPFPHGKQWQQVMKTFSLPPRISHSYCVRNIR